jgi:putative ABC transport system permease protein
VRSLIYFWRVHLAVLLGAAVATAALTGSLAVGDSVRASLRSLWLERLGDVELAVAAPRFFRAALADEVGARLGGGVVAPLILLRGSAEQAASHRRAARIAVLGVDRRFAALYPGGSASGSGSGGDGGEGGGRIGGDGTSGGGIDAAGAAGAGAVPRLVINRTLARALGAEVGDDVLLSWEQPSAIPREMLLAAKDPEAMLATRRYTIGAVVADRGAGSFDLAAGQAPAANAFLPLAEVERALGQGEVANTLLAGRLPPGGGAPAPPARGRRWCAVGSGVLGGAGGELAVGGSRVDVAPARRRGGEGDAGSRRGCGGGRMRGRARKPRGVPAGAGGRGGGSGGSRSGEHGAAGAHLSGARSDGARAQRALLDGERAGRRRRRLGGRAAAGFGGGGGGAVGRRILLDSWAAEDLGVQAGDTVEMTYFLPDTGGAGEPLRSGRAGFRVQGVVALAGLAADRGLTPAFPGIDQAREMASWSPPFPVDLRRVRPRDEAFWRTWGATPKAFVGAWRWGGGCGARASAT